jgi:hypothetical protein
MTGNIRVITFLIVIVTVVTSLGCGPEASEECKEYYAQPSYERDHAFRDSYSIEKQLNIYRCGMQRRPPEFGLAVYIAERGEKNLPIILDRFKAEKDEPTKVGMLFIFELMSQKGYLRGKPDVVDQLNKVVSSMQSKIGREQGEESLKKIIKNSS